MNTPLLSRILIRFGIAFLILGILFKIMHWPYSDVLLIVGFPCIGLGYVIHFFLKTEKSALDFIKLGLVETWALHGIFGYMDWPGYVFLRYSALVFFVAWLIMGGPRSYFEGQNLDKDSFLYKWSIPVLVLLILCIGIGALYKIMHWPGADLLTNIGMFGAAAWILLLTFQKSR